MNPDTTPSRTWQPDTVAMQVPADSAFIATLRLAAASLAARCDLTVDEIEDLRLAVDEACALLLTHARAGSALAAVFTMAPGELTVSVSVPGGQGVTIERSGFGWTVLGALASSVSVSHENDALAITVTKRREAASR